MVYFHILFDIYGEECLCGSAAARNFGKEEAA